MQMLLLNGRSPASNRTVLPSSVIAATRAPNVIVSEANPRYDRYVGAKQYGLG